MRFKRAYAFIVLLLLNSWPADAKESFGKFDEPMKFELASNGGNCAGCEWISAIGVITKDTPKHFEVFIKKHPYPLTVYLNSPGGNLNAGLELGRLFRKHQVNTAIGETKKAVDHWSSETINGVCASACAYAFLGGVDRSIEEKNIYALHQFYNENGQVGYSGSIDIKGDQLSVDQLTSGLIAEYLAEMGVDSRVLTLAALAGKDRFVGLNQKELAELRITTDFKWSDWTLEPAAGGLIMQQNNMDPHYPLRSVAISCLSGEEPLIQVITERTQDWNSQELKSSINGINLKLSGNDVGTPIPADSINVISTEKAFLFQIILTPRQKQSILKNKSYELEFDSARVVFGTFLSVGSEFSNKELEKLKLVWSNCAK